MSVSNEKKFKLRNVLVVTKPIRVSRGFLGLDILVLPVGAKVLVTMYTRNNMDHLNDGYRLKVLPLMWKRTVVFEVDFSTANEHLTLSSSN